MKTTKSNYETYKKEITRLLKLYGLIAWECHVDHEAISSGSLSETFVDLEARHFIITLNKDWANPVTTEKLKETALHEVLEVLFWKLESWIVKSYKEEAREEVHAIIQTFINVSKGR